KYPPSSYKCVDLANGIKKAFESAKMDPQILRLKGITDFLIDGNGKTFSVNGKHYVVRIGNRVWDAFTGTTGKRQINIVYFQGDIYFVLYEK
ncbi:MAG: hypothetical protein GY749_19075, partial [Desulfobacteraceae bacterium]|nr:hypothetical protein [Desulfobacteraceae bacterium]